MRGHREHEIMSDEKIKRMISLFTATDTTDWTDAQMAEELNVCPNTIGSQRRRAGIPTLRGRRNARRKTCQHHLNYDFTCEECGKPFVAHNKKTKRCRSCRYLRNLTYYAIVDTRRVFASLAKTNPVAAQKLQDDMIKEEGFDFKEMALDGILGKTRKEKTNEEQR